MKNPLARFGIGSPPERAAIGEQLSGTGVRLDVLGVGTATGAPIPLPRGGFLKDASGTIVMPQLYEAPLQQLAQAAGGRYLRLALDDSDLRQLLAAAALPDTETIATGRSTDTWEDMGYLFTLPLLPLLLLLFRRGFVGELAHHLRVRL